jgi:phosphoesterase RecJ-like protein
MEGLINMPLSAAEVQAVIFIKALDETIRISLRSKGAVDVRGVAVAHGGGGHRNASGCTLDGPLADAERRILSDVIAAVDGRAS